MQENTTRIIKPEEERIPHTMTYAWAKSQECIMGREGTCGADCTGCTNFLKEHPVIDKNGRMIRR